MDFEPFQYMRYAKRIEYADGIYMAGSGMTPPRPEMLGFKPEDYDLDSLCNSYGDPRNMDWLCEHYRCGGENVMLAAGSSGANFLAFAAVLGAGDRVIVETPGYPQFFSLAALTGARAVPLPRRAENRFLPDPDELAGLLDDHTRMLVLTNLHNPSMTAMPPDHLRALVQVCAQRGVLVLCDEVYLDHLVPGDGDESAWGMGDNVIVTSSLTKVYGLSGLRFGWAIAPRKVTERMLDLADIVDPQLVPLAQNLAIRALASLPRLRPLARRLHESHWPIVREWLNSRPDIEYARPAGGLTVWMRVRGMEETGNLATVLRNDFGTLVVPGEYFQSPGWLRVGYRIEPTALREGLSRLGRAIDEFKAHSHVS
ncbi:MAG: pyridoxal phosphate-dependent aminotransferase [Planctomycetes bacterium]|jgi:aspartate/methionine/tyrosine aminotransferase|nr:pyridoxal phosphate-dependent aminotransferase [Planctomycetota bacterium]MCL4729961.1 pyridoxal phosphate-dependent aminotransferase [Planctomycetota bacterium]